MQFSLPYTTAYPSHSIQTISHAFFHSSSAFSNFFVFCKWKHKCKLTLCRDRSGNYNSNTGHKNCCHLSNPVLQSEGYFKSHEIRTSSVIQWNLRQTPLWVGHLSQIAALLWNQQEFTCGQLLSILFTFYHFILQFCAHFNTSMLATQKNDWFFCTSLYKWESLHPSVPSMELLTNILHISLQSTDHLLTIHWTVTSLFIQYITDLKWNYTKLRGCSPQANYADRVAAACRRS
jgi:hypothetical protein